MASIFGIWRLNARKVLVVYIVGRKVPMELRRLSLKIKFTVSAPKPT